MKVRERKVCSGMSLWDESFSSAYQRRHKGKVEKMRRMKTGTYHHKYTVGTRCEIESYGSKSFRRQSYCSFDKRHGGLDERNEHFGETCGNTHV